MCALQLSGKTCLHSNLPYIDVLGYACVPPQQGIHVLYTCTLKVAKCPITIPCSAIKHLLAHEFQTLMGVYSNNHTIIICITLYYNTPAVGVLSSIAASTSPSLCCHCVPPVAVGGHPGLWSGAPPSAGPVPLTCHTSYVPPALSAEGWAERDGVREGGGREGGGRERGVEQETEREREGEGVREWEGQVEYQGVRKCIGVGRTMEWKWRRKRE